MQEYNDLKIELKLVSEKKEVNFDKIKEYYDNFKIELNNYKDKYDNLRKENIKIKEDYKNLEKEKAKIEETSNILKNLKIINQEANSGEEQESSDNGNVKNPILNKTITDLGNGKVVETIQIITEEEVLPNQSSKKSSGNKKNSNKSNSSLTNIKDVVSPIKSLASSRLFTPLSKNFSNEKNDNDAPDSEFLRKIQKFSNKKEKSYSGLKKSRSENINKMLFRGISSAEKVKRKDENKVDKILERIKKSREKYSDGNEKKENNLIRYKSLKIKGLTGKSEQKKEIEKESEMQEINEEETDRKYSDEKSNENIIKEESHDDLE